MAGTDPANEISELSSTLTSVESVLDPEAMRREADNLRERASDPGLWDDPERAQAVTRRLSYLEGELSRLAGLRRRLDDTRVMFELAESEHDEPTREEATRDLAALRKEIDQLEVRTLLSGEYDAREALITINAQAGGADAADWAEGLRRIYLRWAERHGYSSEIYDTSYAEEAGIKSTTFAIKAPYAYGTLRGEHGTHRMVRISKYDNQGRRQTSFAGVDVIPVVEQTDHIEIPDDDIRVDVYRSSGPGGQGVNTTDSRIELSLDLRRCEGLTPQQRARVLDRLAPRLVDGVLTIAAAEFRSQLRNRRAARERMAELLAEALAPPPPRRKATKPSRGAVARRLDDKARRSKLKKLRNSWD